MEFVLATLNRARDPDHRLSVDELLALLWAPRWSEAEEPVPCRPLVIREPDILALYREPSRCPLRRQKLDVGSIDRWKNSGGKNAVVTLAIPRRFRRRKASTA